jgi:hypothetical protein
VLVPAPLLGGLAAKEVRVSSLLDGLSKVEYGDDDAFGRSVMWARMTVQVVRPAKALRTVVIPEDGVPLARHME